ncbi:hypothetical protein BGY98DRAFT_689087 [Russula aff. rugulosa BPL654]|nr:hypothetical protein BGY98DRAFT_689087 [Russula aff. rugulosa BPL654]
MALNFPTDKISLFVQGETRRDQGSQFSAQIALPLTILCSRFLPVCDLRSVQHIVVWLEVYGFLWRRDFQLEHDHHLPVALESRGKVTAPCLTIMLRRLKLLSHRHLQPEQVRSCLVSLSQSRQKKIERKHQAPIGCTVTMEGTFCSCTFIKPFPDNYAHYFLVC